MWKVPWPPVMPWTMTALLSMRIAMRQATLGGAGDLLGGVGEVVGGMILRAGGGEGWLARLDVGAFEADDERHLDRISLAAATMPFGDDVAAHDAAEDVDQDALHVGVGEDDVEGCGDLSLEAPPPTSRKLAGSPP